MGGRLEKKRILHVKSNKFCNFAFALYEKAGWLLPPCRIMGANLKKIDMIYKLLYSFVKLLSYIPFRVMYFISDILFYLVYYLFRYRRHVVRKNLTESFPEKSHSEIVRIEKKFYHFFVDMMLETCKLASISQKEIMRRLTFQNVEEVNAKMAEGKSVALYLGHYANWEWCSSIPLHLSGSFVPAQIYHKLSNKHMDRLMQYIRERMGTACVEMRKTARYVTELSQKRQVGIIGFIADQAPRKKDIHYFLPFLNHQTPVLTGTEKLIKHYGMEVFFVRVKRVKRGYYAAEYIPMGEASRSVPDFQLTDAYFRLLEKCILEYPELYLWSHNRFRRAQVLGKE